VAGVSRSAAVVASYLVREEGMSLREALAVLVRARPAVRPNDGFIEQLQEVEREVRGEKSLIPTTLPLRLREKLEVLGMGMGAARMAGG
jgi:protein-tyrosine phosphatase